MIEPVDLLDGVVGGSVRASLRIALAAGAEPDRCLAIAVYAANIPLTIAQRMVSDDELYLSNDALRILQDTRVQMGERIADLTAHIDRMFGG